MSITDELNELIASHGNCRDALNVTLAKLRAAQDRIAVLEEAAQHTLAGERAGVCPECGSEIAVCMMGHYCGEKTPAAKA